MTLDLDELERVASAATPGPWEISSWHPSDPDGYADIRGVRPATPVVRLPLAAPNAVRNTAHIATFNPETILTLLARARDAERLEAQIAEARKLLTIKGDEFVLRGPGFALQRARQALSALNEGGPANG